MKRPNLRPYMGKGRDHVGNLGLALGSGLDPSQGTGMDADTSAMDQRKDMNAWTNWRV